jgi:hypothetical protein
VQGHQGDAGFGVELVGVGGQGCVVEEFGESFAAGFGVVGGVGQFLQVFNAAEGFRRAFGFEGFDVAGAVDEEADQLGEGGGVAGGAESWLFFRFFFFMIRLGFGSQVVRFPGLRFETWGTRGSASAFSGTGAWARRRRARSWLASSSVSWFSLPPKSKLGGRFCLRRCSVSGCRAEARTYLFRRAEFEARVGFLAGFRTGSHVRESLPAKSGSIMAWASRMSCRKESRAISARRGSADS